MLNLPRSICRSDRNLRIEIRDQLYQNTGYLFGIPEAKRFVSLILAAWG